jgi:hypothetical protein
MAQYIVRLVSTPIIAWAVGRYTVDNTVIMERVLLSDDPSVNVRATDFLTMIPAHGQIDYRLVLCDKDGRILKRPCNGEVVEYPLGIHHPTSPRIAEFEEKLKAEQALVNTSRDESRFSYYFHEINPPILSEDGESFHFREEDYS